MLDERSRREFDDQVNALRAQLDDATFEQARAEGRAMSFEQAIEYALENLNSTL